MPKVTFIFDTVLEAIAFKAGIEYVNDGQIEHVDRNETRVSFIDHDEEDQPHRYDMRKPKPLPKPKKKRGKLTTGRFDTREQLVDRICTMYWLNGRSVAAAARNAKVSETTAHNVLRCPEAKEWRKEYLHRD